MADESTHDQSQWRIALAKKLAPVYSGIPAVQALVLIGGVARGRSDEYSDIDLAVYWETAPSEAQRRAALQQIEHTLNTPLTIAGFAAYPLTDNPADGLWREEAAFVGGDETTGFKIDVNHHTVESMERIIDDVILRHDTHGAKLERLYSIQHVLILCGAALITRWQQRASVYPDELAQKLVALHLREIDADLDVHRRRADLLLFYQAVTSAQYHIMAALLALNHIYRPELKRLDDLCAELTIAPNDLAGRLKRILRDDPQQAARELDALVDEVFALVEAHMPSFDIAPIRANFQIRRQPFHAPPFKL